MIYLCVRTMDIVYPIIYILLQLLSFHILKFITNFFPRLIFNFLEFIHKDVDKRYLLCYYLGLVFVSPERFPLIFASLHVEMWKSKFYTKKVKIGGSLF